MPEIIKAKTAGFCPGVRSAVMTVYRLLDENKGIICTIGPIIHNRQVVEDLKSRGVKVFDRVCDIKGCSHAVIRAHGVPPEVYSELKENDIDYIDATCPYVKKIHELVSKRKDENYKIIIAGDRNHPEVIGINGWSGGTASTVSTPAEAAKLEADPEARVCVVGQTTITRENWDEIIKVLAGRFRNIEINDTLCSASLNRQKEAEEIASAADIMIVIGGSDSSNTQKLFEICSRHCEETYKVETADDLPELMTGLKLKLSENRSKTTADKKDAGERRHIRKIGVTAGA